MKTITVIATAVAVLGVAYVVMMPPPYPDSIREPDVLMLAADAQGSNLWKVKIAGVTRTADLVHFEAVLERNHTLEERLDPLTGNATHIDFSDAQGEGKLTPGDYFIVMCYPESEYKLTVIWKESGNASGESQWLT